MKVTISRTTGYNAGHVPFESFDLRVEATENVVADNPHRIADVYLELRDKLNKAIKEETK